MALDRTLVYLDSASLAPPTAEAILAMSLAARESWGNPRSLHAIGGRAARALEEARQQVADYVDTAAHEIVFVASGTCALSRAFALALARLPAGGTVAGSRLDHPALQALVEAASRAGHDVRWLSLPEGVPSDEDRATLAAASLVALSACNHEMGTLLALDAVSPGALRVIDAVQAAPWISLAPLADARTYYAVSGAKLGAPQGVGVLRVPGAVFHAARDAGAPLEGDSPPWLAAIGLGASCAARSATRDAALERARALASRLVLGLQEIDPAVAINGAPSARLGPIVSASFPGVAGKALVTALSMRGVCISHTAACQSRRIDASPVVRAAYPGAPERAVGATRWSVSEHLDDAAIDRALDAARDAWRSLGPR